MVNKINRSIYLILFPILLFSCKASKKAQMERLYLQGVDSLNNIPLVIPEQVVQKGDLLSILVYSDNKEATEIFNQPQTGTGGAGGNMGGFAATGRGYQVDVQGRIYFHSLGWLQVAGLTKGQIADTIQTGLLPYLQNPYVTVRFTNANITVLGEVNRPGRIELPDRRLSILDAIALSGDLTNFGRRDNILVMREDHGQRKVYRVDLRKSDIYQSPVFYLQQNDMVYVEPNRRKPTGNEQVLMRNVAIGTSILSIITLLLTLVTR